MAKKEEEEEKNLIRTQGWIGGAQKSFRAVKLLCDTIMMDIYGYMFAQTLRMGTTKSELWALGDDDVSMQDHQL